MYIKPLSATMDSHSITHYSLANDLQLQMSAPPDKIYELLHYAAMYKWCQSLGNCKHA